jgi:hypothetical protein
VIACSLALQPPIVVANCLLRLLKLDTCLSARRVADRDPALRQTISPSSFVAWNSIDAQQHQCKVGAQGQNCEAADRPSARSDWTETLSRALHAAVDEMLAGYQLPPEAPSQPVFVNAVTTAMGAELQQWRSTVMATALGSK